MFQTNMYMECCNDGSSGVPSLQNSNKGDDQSKSWTQISSSLRGNKYDMDLFFIVKVTLSSKFYQLYPTASKIYLILLN